MNASLQAQWVRVASLLLVSWTTLISPADAQVSNTLGLTRMARSVPAPETRTFRPHVVKWYEVLAAVGIASAAFLVDEPVQRYLQRHRSDASDDVAAAFRHIGQPEVYGTVTVGLVGAGLLGGNPSLTRAGGRVAASVLLSAAEFESLKRLTGRARPDSGLGAFHFDPFSGSQSLPSGHVTVAFTLAASLADDIHKPWATVGLYTLATGTAFSRLNDDRHWLSDAAFGATLGIATAKFIDGHWRFFGIRPLHFLLSPSATGIAVSAAL
jgi:membrane-associated phospholipid phosphatase